MSKAIQIGSVLGLAGGILMLIEILRAFNPGQAGRLVNLALAFVVIVGGILGLAKKKVAGGILLLTGIVLVFVGIMSVYTPNVDLLPYSVFGQFGVGQPQSNLIAGIPLEAFLILAGGIIVLASPQE